MTSNPLTKLQVITLPDDGTRRILLSVHDYASSEVLLQLDGPVELVRGMLADWMTPTSPAARKTLEQVLGDIVATLPAPARDAFLVPGCVKRANTYRCDVCGRWSVKLEGFAPHGLGCTKDVGPHG
jgi:hypothetical protein